MGRLIRVLAILAFVVFLISVVCLSTLFIVTGTGPIGLARSSLNNLVVAIRSDDLNRPAGIDPTPLRFEVALGDTPQAIANNLFSEGLIDDPALFVSFVQARNIDVELEAGVYFLNKTQTLPDIAFLLTDSASSQLPFRILEGWRIEQIADAVDASSLFGFTGAELMAVIGPGAPQPPEFAAFVNLPPGASLEGFMYPDTYLLPAEVTPEMMRDILLETFQQRVDDDLRRAAAAQGFSLFEVVTLASIAEKEALHDDEHDEITGVYRNRLDINMKLDADPTVQYGLNGARGSWWPRITRADYTGVISPYNTYLGPGLPPGPIANPGISAIRAAVFPTESEFIFFRARCDGSGYHDYAITYQEHVQNGC